MQDSVPSDSQIRELWEWCGFCCHNLTEPHDYLKTECKKCGEKFENIYNVPQPPEIVDLNNLFKYAVPKVRELGWDMAFYIDSHDTTCELYGKDYGGSYESGAGEYGQSNENPALALFWAIWEIIKEEK